MPSDELDLDVVIFGGGAAGLWLLDDLRRRGDRAVLLEAERLGSGQTIASQGIIHGGLKYTLTGAMNASARTIRDMPLIWRRCLAGEQAPNLAGTRLRAEYCHLWQTTSLRSRLGMIGARAGLRVGPERLDDDTRPAVLRACPGIVARIDEQVIEPGSFLDTLAHQHHGHLLRIDVDHGLELETGGGGHVERVRLINPEDGHALDLRPAHVVLCAGAGNEALRRMAGLDDEAMQRRPLHMVLVRGRIPVLNGHCVDGMHTRATITSAIDHADRVVWQVGGQIAEGGVDRSGEALVAHAARELAAVLPGVDLGAAEWATYRVDRAEARQRGRRPADVAARREGNVITAWPTKLALAPRLAEKVGTLMASTDAGAPLDASMLRDWPRPDVADPPWEEDLTWYDAP